MYCRYGIIRFVGREDISVNDEIYQNEYVVFDCETTGLDCLTNEIIEIGAVQIRDGKKTATYGMLVNPHCNIEPIVSELTGITDEMLKDGMDEDKAVEGLLEFIGSDIIVGHNVSFDYSFIKQWAVNKKIPLDLYALDTENVKGIASGRAEKETGGIV